MNKNSDSGSTAGPNETQREISKAMETHTVEEASKPKKILPKINHIQEMRRIIGKINNDIAIPFKERFNDIVEVLSQEQEDFQQRLEGVQSRSKSHKESMSVDLNSTKKKFENLYLPSHETEVDLITEKLKKEIETNKSDSPQISNNSVLREKSQISFETANSYSYKSKKYESFSADNAPPSFWIVFVSLAIAVLFLLMEWWIVAAISASPAIYTFIKHADAKAIFLGHASSIAQTNLLLDAWLAAEVENNRVQNEAVENHARARYSKLVQDLLPIAEDLKKQISEYTSATKFIGADWSSKRWAEWGDEPSIASAFRIGKINFHLAFDDSDDVHEDLQHQRAETAGTIAHRGGQLDAVNESDLRIGENYTGTVFRVLDSGAFIKFDDEKIGLLHAGELAQDKVEKISDVISEGDEVRVKLIGFGQQNQPRLSMKSLDIETSHSDSFKDQAEAVGSITEAGITYQFPALLPFGGGESVLFETSGSGKDKVSKTLQSTFLRLLATVAPGKLRFTFLDPVGLGQNVAAFLPLGDKEEVLVTSRAWTEPQHIEKQLTDLTEHIETVIQKYLRTSFATIEDYNNHAGEVAEPYRVLVVMDFPVNFSEAAARRLVSIAQNGPRCGIYTFVVRDMAKDLPYGFDIEDLQKSSTVISQKDGRFAWDEIEQFPEFSLSLDSGPPENILNTVIEIVGDSAPDAMKVEVPYEKLLQLAGIEEGNHWKRSTHDGIESPLGPSGAQKIQQISFGHGTSHHALIVGRTGSGKSNLMHVLITGLALSYSPDEIELYLIDFKKGVEFKPYALAALPHARVIAIESEREFGYSVLEGLDAELQRRGELFRGVAANDVAEFREKSDERMPRILLIIDEFQEFFSQDDNLSSRSSLMMDRLVRQGRSFGIHLFLGTQTLSGAYGLARSTLEQMQIRIALQCSEADSRLILADDNPAARLLSRPGEAIYNASSGMIEGNQQFQVALFSDDDRDGYLKVISDLAKDSDQTQRVPVIFEGHEPGSIETCKPLGDVLGLDEWPGKTGTHDAWLGEPIALQPATFARFRRQGGSHLLAIAREENEGVGLMTACVTSLAAQHNPDTAKFFIVDLTLADAPWAEVPELMQELFPHQIEVLGRREIPELFSRLSAEVDSRIEVEQGDEAELYLVIIGLQRARDLRQNDHGASFSFGEDADTGPSLSAQLQMLLREGPDCGLHVLAWCDTFGNAQRVLDHRMLSEFGVRIATGMSNDDSHGFLDDPSAARLDRPHRAVKFDEENVGVIETFRPFAIPSNDWLEQVARKMHSR